MAVLFLLPFVTLLVTVAVAVAVADEWPLLLPEYQEDTMSTDRALLPSGGHCSYIPQEDGVSVHVFCNSTSVESLSGLPPNVTQLEWSGSNQTFLQKKPFGHLPDLLVLRLRRNRIRFVLSDAFAGLHRLHTLDLSHNLIQQLHPKSLEPCRSLEVLDLSSNYIAKVQSVARSASLLPHLRQLILRDNQLLESIGENELAPLASTSMTSLDLSECQLRSIYSTTFSSVPNVTQLDLSYNPFNLLNLTIALASLPMTNVNSLKLKGLRQLKRIPTLAFNHLSSSRLRTLVLSENKFSRLLNGDFPPIPTLESLEMSRCEIEDIDTNVFANLTALQKLDLSQHRLAAFPVSVGRVRTLRSLNLSSKNYHPHHEVGGGASPFLGSSTNLPFLNLTSLEELSLQRVSIPRLARHHLHGLSSLRLLSLAATGMVFIDDFAFETLTSLTKLDLSENNFQGTISQETFAGLGALEHLDLLQSQVELDGRHNVTFGRLVNLRVLNLRRNKLTTMLHADLSVLTRLEMLLLDSNAVVPWHHPLLLPSNASLQYVSLRQNNLYTVTAAMLKDLGRLEAADLSENPFNCSSCELHTFAQWAAATDVQLYSLAKTTCISPKHVAGQTVLSQPLPATCSLHQSHLVLVVVITVAAVILLSLVLVATCVYFRWYMRYWWFLTRVKVYPGRPPPAEHQPHKACCQYEAFVSYNEKDRAWVKQQLVPKTEGTRLCLHERDFEVSKQAVAANVVESIERSRKVVLVLSKSFVASQWCTWETQLARLMTDDARDNLVLVVLEAIDKRQTSPTLRYLMRTRTCLEWTDHWQGQKLFWERLRHALRKPDAKPQLLSLV